MFLRKTVQYDGILDKLKLRIVALSYVDDCIYLYTIEALGKWFVDNLGKIFHVNFLGYAHWFMCISQEFHHGIYFLKYTRTIFQEPHKYTNRNSHQHKIIQQFLIHLVHIYYR